jgi:hypothetical protein
MKKIKFLIPFVFPAFVILLGLIIYKILEYEPSFYTISVNIGGAYILAPRLKKVKKQLGTETQVTWLFYKYVIK